MQSGKRILIVMRHAKAEPFGVDDHARVLTPRGRRDAAQAGMWLAGRGLTPDHAIVSSSARTQGTWEAVAAATRTAAEPAVERALYTADPESALELIRGVDQDTRTLLVIGHNPTIAYLAHVLGDQHPDAEAFRQLSQGYPTSAATVLEVPGSWSDLDEAGARLADFYVGCG